MKKINIIGAPSDLGANIRGSCMGPEAIRIAKVIERTSRLGYQVTDLGNINVPIRKDENLDANLSCITEICTELAQLTAQSCQNNAIPITLGGDHSISIGSISGVTQTHINLGVLWVDTHGDLNTPETSPTQNIHGMPLATLIGKGHSQLTNIFNTNPKINPKHIALIGLRSLDGKEKEILQQSGIHYFTMKDIDEQGIISIMKQSLDIVSQNTSGIHVSFDLDVIEPIYMSSVSTAVSGGLNLREAHIIMEMVAETKLLSSLDIVELNPFVGKNAINDAHTAVDLILSALGKSII